MAQLVARFTRSYCLEVGGWSEHCHCSIRIDSRDALADVVRELKSRSARWIREQGLDPEFEWQRGYWAASISPSAVPALRRYIQRQDSLHRGRNTLERELRQFSQLHRFEE